MLRASAIPLKPITNNVGCFGEPHREIVEPGKREWDIFEPICVDTDTRGNRITDAWYAALAIEWGCGWTTFDRDFARSRFEVAGAFYSHVSGYWGQRA